MPATHYRRERMSKSGLRMLAADACRYVEIVDDQAELDCPRCVQTLRIRHVDNEVFREGGPMWSVLVDHLFGECPGVEYDR